MIRRFGISSKKKKKNMKENDVKKRILESLDDVYWVDHVTAFERNSDYSSVFEQKFGHISRVSIMFDGLTIPFNKLDDFHVLMKKWSFDSVLQYGIDCYKQGYYFSNELIMCFTPILIPKPINYDDKRIEDEDDDIPASMEKTSIVFAPLIKNKSKIIKFMKELLDSGILTMTENDKKFFMIAQGSHGLYKQQTSFKNIPIKDDRYDLYYGKDFPHEKIMDFFKEESDNLMILHGIPGSGKSNYIKNLITQSKEDVIYVPPSMIGVISDPSFVSFMLENKNNVLIIEDAEQILSNERNSATNNLLGLTDGFLKDSLKLKIITTLNADISTIDKALLRKGRLHLSHNFKKLSADEANELAKFCDIDHEFDEDIALCDIFNFDKFHSPLKNSERPMGFGNF